MTFGNAIKQLLLINGIKMGNLAVFLGYDISYLSKWINDSKLPSSKNAEYICKRIASYVTELSTPAACIETAAELKFELTDDLDFENALFHQLYTIFLKQKNPASYVPRIENNAIILTDSSSLAKEIQDEIISLYRKSNSTQLEVILIMPTDFLLSNDISAINQLCNLENSRKKIHIRQIINLPDFPGDVNSYVCYLLKHISLRHPIQMDFYEPISHSSVPSQNPILIVKDEVVVQGISDSITGRQHFSLVTHDPSIVLEYYHLADLYLKTLTPSMERLKHKDIQNMNLPYNYAMQRKNQYIMRSMELIHLSPELLEVILDKYLDTPELYDYHRKMLEITCESCNSLITYESTLINYINTGNIQLFDRIITLSRNDRKRHLMHLIEELESHSQISLKILSDKNPLLDYNDNILTMYLNENGAFGVYYDNNVMNEIIYFTSPTICQALNDFYSHIDSLPDRYLKSGQRVIDYIYNGIKMI